MKREFVAGRIPYGWVRESFPLATGCAKRWHTWFAYVVAFQLQRSVTDLAHVVQEVHVLPPTSCLCQTSTAERSIAPSSCTCCVQCQGCASACVSTFMMSICLSVYSDSMYISVGFDIVQLPTCLYVIFVRVTLGHSSRWTDRAWPGAGLCEALSLLFYPEQSSSD